MRKGIEVLLLAGLLLTGAWGQDNTEQAKRNQDQGRVAQSTKEESIGATYVIGPEDTLHVSVWKEPDLTATLPVRPDGKISLPLLNDVQAAGLTPMQLADSITEKLKKYISDPRVTVVVTAMNSQRVYVLGEVMHTGAMPLTPGMTVLQALASAGFTQFANTKGIYVLRVENSKQQKLPFNYKQVVKGESMAQNVVLKPGDTIVVP
ncbi:MAG TPA: polysaccharide biosynthesis/export family protein [Terriglobales bacterium]|jgi:polysaccharide export outer membrane protein